MSDKAINDIEVAPTSVVKQSARNFASVLAETSQFKTFEQAAERFRQDQAAPRRRGLLERGRLRRHD